MRAPRLWQWWLVISLVAIAGYFLLPLDDFPKNLYYDTIGISSAIMIVVGARRNAPPRAILWYLFAAGLTLWSIGDLTFGIITKVMHIEAFPTAADVLYLAAYPVLAAGGFVLIRGRTPGRDRAGLLDALIISTGLSLLTWTLVMEPILHWEANVLVKAVSLAYPSGDLLLIVMAARLFTAPGARTASYRLLSSALVLLFGADIVYTWLLNTTGYDGGAVTAGWLLSYVLWAAAALHPSMRSLSETAPEKAPRVTGKRLTILTTSSMLAPFILAWQGVVDARNIQWQAITAGAVVLLLLVQFRMSGLVSHVQDQAAQLDALAHNDALTGVPNRRAWDLELARRLATAHRDDVPVVVAVLDIDHFKKFNDRYGHQAGDRLLKEASAAWRGQLRGDDLLARYGGEEFGVCITGMSAPAVANLLDRLRTATPLGQSFSARVARWSGNESPEALVGRADQALYLAKDSGRNQTKVHADDADRAPADIVDIPTAQRQRTATG